LGVATRAAVAATLGGGGAVAATLGGVACSARAAVDQTLRVAVLDGRAAVHLSAAGHRARSIGAGCLTAAARRVAVIIAKLSAGRRLEQWPTSFTVVVPRPRRQLPLPAAHRPFSVA